MSRKYRWLLFVLGFLLTAYLIWFFSNIVIYILIAVVLSVMGRPMVKMLDQISIGKRKMPRTLSALIALVVIYGLIGGFFAIIVPILIQQIQSLANVNPIVLMNSLKEPLSRVNDFFKYYKIISPEESIEMMVTNKVMNYVNITSVSGVANTLFGLAGNIFIAIFSVGFITFYFLQQNRMFLNGIMLLTPIGFQTEIKHIYYKIIKMLSRYFLGLCFDLLVVISLISLSAWLFGFKNALMIGFFAGIMNIIPYLGPFIGWGLAMIFAITGVIEAGQTPDFFPILMKISGIIVVVNILDAFIFQPNIYANVVKAHPLEIFIVILMAGSIAGVPGMILAIPSYTVLRIIAKEFFNKSRLVNKVTTNI